MQFLNLGQKSLRAVVRVAIFVVAVFVLVLLYHTQFEPFRERNPEIFSWLPNPKDRETVTVIERNQETTITESDFVPRLIVNTQNIAVTVISKNLEQRKEASGFFITNDGVFVASAWEVLVGKGATYTVFTLDGKRYDSALIGVDPYTETAYFRAGVGSSPTLTLVPDDSAFVGRRVLMIRRSLEGSAPVAEPSSLAEKSHTTNIARQRLGSSEKYEGVLRSEHGDSASPGSAVVTYQGELFGFAHHASEEESPQTLIIPIRAIMDGLDRMRSGGENANRAYLGVSYISLTPENALMYDAPATAGAWIKDTEFQVSVVNPLSPASLSGIRQGDVILAVGEREVTPEDSLAELISSFSPGDTVELRVLREGSEKMISVTFAKMPVASTTPRPAKSPVTATR